MGYAQSMSYAVLQTTLERLDPARLAAAFEALPNWTRHDAGVIARDQDGLIAQRLTPDEAKQMAAAIRRQGIDVVAVDEHELVELPQIKRLRRLDALPPSLVVYDALGRPTHVEWPSVMAVNAGVVTRTVFERGEPEFMGGEYPVVYYPQAEKNIDGLMAELILDVEPRRCQFEAATLNYMYLADRRAMADAVANFLTLLGDLRRHATAAMFGRGALTLLGESDLGYSYRNRTTFEEEMVWMLWRLHRLLLDEAADPLTGEAEGA